MRAKPLNFAISLVILFSHGANCMGAQPEFNPLDQLELSKLDSWLQKTPFSWLVASIDSDGCRHVAIAVDKGSGLPIWEVALYSARLGSKSLSRELLATSNQNISRLEFSSGFLKAIVDDEESPVLSFRTRSCGG